MPVFHIRTQERIIVATMVLHNLLEHMKTVTLDVGFLHGAHLEVAREVITVKWHVNFSLDEPKMKVVRNNTQHRYVGCLHCRN